MSKISLASNASGTGIFTLASPATNTNRTLTLPDSTGTLLDTNGGTITGTLTVTGVTTLGNGAVLGVPASGTVTNLTGTASININGTVGATTATTGAFTTLSATGATTLATTSVFGGPGTAAGLTALTVGDATNATFRMAFTNGPLIQVATNTSVTLAFGAKESSSGAFTQWAALSSTGLAVTGTLTSTGNVGAGTTTTNYPLSLPTNISTYQATGTQMGFGTSGFSGYGPHIGTANRTYVHFTGAGGGSVMSSWFHGYQVGNPAASNWIRVAPGIAGNPVSGLVVQSTGVSWYYNASKTTGDPDYTPTLFHTLDASGAAFTGYLNATASSGTVSTLTQTSATGYGLGIIPGADTYAALFINNAANTHNRIQMFGNGTATFYGGVGIGGAASPGSTGLAVTGTLSVTMNSALSFDATNIATWNYAGFANTTSGAFKNIGVLFTTELNGEVFVGAVENAGNTNADFVIAIRSGGNRAERLRLTSTGTLSGGTSGTGYSFSGSAPATSLTLDSSGNLSVGSTGGTDRLNVEAPANLADFYSTTYAAQLRIKAIASNVLTFAGGTADSLAFETGGTERARIDSNGFFKSQAYGGAYFGGSNHQILNNNNTSGDVCLIIGNAAGNATNNTSSYSFIASDASGDRLYIYGNGNVVNINNSYGTLSDVKLKENIVDATPKLDDVMRLQVRNFNLKSNPELKQIGFVAQELEQIFPALIDESPDRDAEGNITEEMTKSIKTSVLVPILVKAIQEQQALITTLTARITALETA